ncbi:MAG: hypothetical protein QXK12_06410 [Candidatus Nezhaarchaeales archaeon]
MRLAMSIQWVLMVEKEVIGLSEVINSWLLKLRSEVKYGYSVVSALIEGVEGRIKGLNDRILADEEKALMLIRSEQEGLAKEVLLHRELLKFRVAQLKMHLDDLHALTRKVEKLTASVNTALRRLSSATSTLKVGSKDAESVRRSLMAISNALAILLKGQKALKVLNEAVERSRLAVEAADRLLLESGALLEELKEDVKEWKLAGGDPEKALSNALKELSSKDNVKVKP